MSSKKPKTSNRPLISDPKYNYLSSDNGGTTSASVAGIGYTQYSDDNISEHQNRNQNQNPAPNNSMYRAHNNPHLISNKFNTNKQQNRHYRRKKHSKQTQPNISYPPQYYPYPPNMAYPPNQPHYPYPYPPPYPYPAPYPYPTVPAHGDVAVTQSYTPPPPGFHQRPDKREQIPPYYYYPSPYYGHAPPHNNAPYPYGHFAVPPSHYPRRPKPKQRQLQSQRNMNEEETVIANAEPVDDDVNATHKLFSDHGNDGYENDETDTHTQRNRAEIDLFDTYHSSFASQKHKNISREPSPVSSEDSANCFKLCVLLCDMENAFEVIEILILLVFIAFLGVWWVDRDNQVLLLSLAGCSSIFGMLVINMRRAQSSLRLHELGSTLNDFRFILFTIGLCIVIAADQMRYAMNESDDNIRYLWMAHSFVWIISGMLWCTIDFAPYMSYFVSTAYHCFILIGTALEFAKVCYQISDVNDTPQTLYSHNGILYTLYDFKIDGLVLMLMVEISTILTLMTDRKREWYCFGLSHVYRHRLLQISQRQERMVQNMTNMIDRQHRPMGRHHSIGSSHLIHNVSGNRYFYMFGSNEDSLLLIWIINLSIVTYLTFFLWDAHSAYKSIPASMGILSFVVLSYRECDFHLIPLMKRQTHCWFLVISLFEIWFVTVYSSVYVGMDIGKDNKDEMWKEIGSFFVDICTLSMGMVLIFATDLLISSVSSYFIIRGTIPIMMCSVSAFSAWYQSFNSRSLNKIMNDSWPISIVARNGYYILMTMCLVSIIKWVRDPIHKYFIYILDRRKRTILYEHKYRDHLNTNNKLFNDSTRVRDHSMTATQMAHSRSLLPPNHGYYDNSNGQNEQPFYDNRMQKLSSKIDKKSRQYQNDDL